MWYSVIDIKKGGQAYRVGSMILVAGRTFVEEHPAVL